MALNKIELLALIDQDFTPGVQDGVTTTKLRDDLKEIVEFTDAGSFENIDLEYDIEATYNTTDNKYAEANGRLYKSKREGNTGNIPPDQPDPTSGDYENFWWIEISKNDGLLQIYKPGLFGEGTVIVYHSYNGNKKEWNGVRFWELAVPELERPFESADIVAEIEGAEPKWVPAQQVAPHFPNMILEGLAISQAGNDITVSPGRWLIDQVNFEITDPVTVTLSAVAEGFERIDVIIANDENEIAVVEGVAKDLSDDETSTVKPSVPAGSIEIGFAIVGTEVQVQEVDLYESKTYAELKSLVNANELKPGKFYLLSDFRTKHMIPNTEVETDLGGGDFSYTGEIHSGAIEPLVLFAVSQNKFSPTVFSTIHPQDKIEYDFSDNKCEEYILNFLGFYEYSNGTPRPGKITSRIDTAYNVGTLGYDFREVTYKLFRLQLFYETGVKVSSSIVEVPESNAFTIGLFLEASNFKLVDISAFLVHDANPEFQLSSTSGTPTTAKRGLVKADGSSFAADEIPTYINSLSADAAYMLVLYNKTIDKFMLLSNKEANDRLNTGFGETYIFSSEPPLVDSSIGFRFRVDETDTKYLKTFESYNPTPTDTNFSNITIEAKAVPPIDEFVGATPYNEVYFSGRGARNVQIKDGSHNIYFSERQDYDDLIIERNCNHVIVCGICDGSLLSNVTYSNLLADFRKSKLENIIYGTFIVNISESQAVNFNRIFSITNINRSELQDLKNSLFFNISLSDSSIRAKKRYKCYLPSVGALTNYRDYVPTETVEDIVENKSDTAVFKNIEAENITGSNIDREELEFTALTFAASLTVTIAATIKKIKRTLTLTGNVTTLAFSGLKNGDRGTIYVTQDATGGRTIAKPVGHLGEFVINDAPDEITELTFEYNGTNVVWRSAPVV